MAYINLEEIRKAADQVEKLAIGPLSEVEALSLGFQLKQLDAMLNIQIQLQYLKEAIENKNGK
ncbi:hypothetical protein [Algoriphagus pacificus]|uniref:Uncharacterized protein n=1 Tax=Algoriphagus pacificus TaxID=2811234 RepID=A0ABS3CAY1_9BACT|nr:hypothetical protein [Algoriphagus pacificus]MBN7814218.1 hypothetical protein [Algoriphagus pacificus]